MRCLLHQVTLRAAALLLATALVALGSSSSSSGGVAPSSVIVVGSINADVIVPLLKLPKVGETVVAKETEATGITVAGGKGANTAVTCARMGVPTQFAAQFGSDANAAMLKETLAANLVDTSFCQEVAAPSGMGLVLLCDEGGSTCIVCSGSNGKWNDDRISALAKEISTAPQSACVVMLQMEVPQRVNDAIAQAASDASIPVFQDLGGEDRPVSPEHLRRCTYLSPNLSELKRLTNLPCGSREEIIAACKTLQSQGARNVLVTLGDEGSLLVTEDSGEVIFQEALRADKVVDETGAGDNFRAAFCASHFSEKRSVKESLLRASAAAAVSVSKMGAIPACCRREECEALLAKHKLTTIKGGASSTEEEKTDEVFPLKFASRLNSMKDRMDLWESNTEVGTSPLGPPVKGIAPGLRSMIKRQGTIKGLDLIDFNYPQHLTDPVTEESKSAVLQSLAENGLGCGAICLRFPKEMKAGALTAPDPAIRKRALDLCMEACEWSQALGCNEVVIWSAFDGYDYSMQADYDALWDLYVTAIRRICDKYPRVKVSLEYKPTDENCRFFAVPSTGAAMLLVNEVKRRNFGLTLDFGHCLMAGENPAQSVAMVQKRGIGGGGGWFGASGKGANKLFGIQLGDGYGRLGAEDGLAFGSVHSLASLELVYYLAKTNFDGHVYFDTFPRNEDPVKECEYNIRRFKHMYKKSKRMLLGEDKSRIEELLKKHDALGMLEYLEKE